MIVHCNNSFSPDEVLFLRDNDMFNHRRIETGECPICSKFVVKLYEIRNTDGKVFDSVYNNDRGMAGRILDEYQNDVIYSTAELSRPKGTPFGFKYGESKEIKDRKTGETKIIVKSCDFYGNKEVIDVKKA